MLRFFLLTFYCLLGSLAKAVHPATIDEDIHIDAQKEITYHEGGMVCVAKGHVHVTKGSQHMLGDEIRVYFVQQQSRTMIRAIDILGNASLSSEDGQLTAQRIHYTVPTETLEAFGGDITLTTPQYYVHAKKKLQYCKQQQAGYAEGDVEFQEDTKAIQADRVFLTFQPKDDLAEDTSSLHGNAALKTVKAFGHVVVEQEDQQGFCDQAFYDALTQCAQLRGHVRLRHHNNFGTGDRAWMNFATKKAGMLSAPTSRVHLLLYPETRKRKP